MVEAGELDGPATAAAVHGYLDELLRRGPAIDTLLLGCTHYPLLRPVIEELRRSGGEAWSTRPSPPRWPSRTCSTRSAGAPRRTTPDGAPANRIATTGDVARLQSRRRARLRRAPPARWRQADA